VNSRWVGKEFPVKQVSQLYLDAAGDWLLLEILELDADGEPQRLKLLAKSRDKSKLHDRIMDDDNWNWQKRYLLVHADPHKPCTIKT